MDFIGFPCQNLLGAAAMLTGGSVAGESRTNGPVARSLEVSFLALFFLVVFFAAFFFAILPPLEGGRSVGYLHLNITQQVV